MLQTAVVHSVELDSQDAVEDALDQCREKLGDVKPQAGILFAGIYHDFQLILDKINNAYQGIEIIGCTTDGEMSSVYGFAEDSIVLMMFYSDELRFVAGVADRISESTISYVQKAAETALSGLGKEPKLCIATPSSLTVDGEDVIAGLKKSFGDAFPIFGGTAGDQWNIQETYQFCNTRVFTDAAPFLIVAGPLLYSSGLDCGWMPIGQKEKITRSVKNVVYEIGDQTALQFYKHYLGNSISANVVGHMGDFPLAVYVDDGERFYLRSSPFDIPTSDEEGITFVATVPEGATVQITTAPRDDIIMAAKHSVRSAMDEYPGEHPAVAICFSCAARKFILGSRVEEEYKNLKDNYPSLPVAGFYTYGEIGPLQRDKPSLFHNDTFVSLLIGTD